MVGNIGVLELSLVLIISVVFAIAVIWPASRICAKAGYSPWLGIAAVIPVLNVLLLWFLAFAEWPRHRTTGS